MAYTPLSDEDREARRRRLLSRYRKPDAGLQGAETGMDLMDRPALPSTSEGSMPPSSDPRLLGDFTQRAGASPEPRIERAAAPMQTPQLPASQPGTAPARSMADILGVERPAWQGARPSATLPTTPATSPIGAGTTSAMTPQRSMAEVFSDSERRRGFDIDVDIPASLRLPAKVLYNLGGDVKEMTTGISALLGLAVSGAMYGFRHPWQAGQELPGAVAEWAPKMAEAVWDDFAEYWRNPKEKLLNDPLFVLLDVGSVVTFGGLGLAKTGVVAGSKGAVAFGRRAIQAGEMLEGVTPARLAVKGVKAAGGKLLERVPALAERASETFLSQSVQKIWVGERAIRDTLRGGAVRTAGKMFQNLTPDEKAMFVLFMEGRDLGGFQVTDAMREAADGWRKIQEPFQDMLLSTQLVTPKKMEEVLFQIAGKDVGVEGVEELLEWVGIADPAQLLRTPGEIAKARAGGLQVLEFSEAVTRAKAAGRGIERRAGIEVGADLEDELAEYTGEVWRDAPVYMLPPDVTVAAPSYMPMVVASQVQRGRPFGNLRAMWRGTAPEGLLSKLEQAEAGAGPELRRALGEARGDVSGSGGMREPFFLHERSGKAFSSPERVTDPETLMSYLFFERSDMVAKLSLIRELTDTYAFKLTRNMNDPKAFSVKAPGASGAADMELGVEDFAELLKNGFEWQGKRYAGNLWTPDHFAQSRLMTHEVLGNTLAGMRKNLSLEESLGEALKRLPGGGKVEPAGKVSRAENIWSLLKVKRPKDWADKGTMYVIPDVVAENIRKIANAGRYPSGVGGVALALWDDTIDFYRSIWLRTPRFVVNNTAGNAMVALLSGVNLSDMWDAASKKYAPFLDDIPGLNVNMISAELRNPTLSSRAVANPVRNFLNLMRQESVLKAFGETFETASRESRNFWRRAASFHEVRATTKAAVGALGESLEIASRESENFWRRAAFVHDVKQKTKALQGGELAIERLAGQMAKRTKGMPKEEVLRRLVNMNGNMIDGAITDELVQRIDMVKGSPELFNDAIGYVNKYFFDYFALLPEERAVMRRLVPFYSWVKNIHRLAVQMPVDHPGRTMLMAHVGAVAGDLTEQDDVPNWLRGSVPFLNDTDYRVSGESLNPFGHLFNVQDVGFHPLLSYFVTAVSGGKTFPRGGRYTEQNVLKGMTGQWRVDPETGEVLEEVDVVVPSIPEYFAGIIPYVNMMLEAGKFAVSKMPESAITDFGEALFGEPDGKRETRGGITYEERHPLQGWASWFGLPLRAGSPRGFKAARDREIRRLRSRVRERQREDRRGVLEKATRP